MSKGAIGFVVAALAAGCGHGGTSQQASSAREEAASSFADAYESVRSGAKASVRWGEYMFDRAGAGAVRVYREARTGAESAGGAASDAYVTSKVHGKLATDPGVHSRDIDVETDAGVVTLRGTVRSSQEAARAVQDTMSVGGVFAVNSELGWPAMRTGQRSPSVEQRPQEQVEGQPGLQEQGLPPPELKTPPEPGAPSPAPPPIQPPPIDNPTTP